ncbi:MAG: hypothetical protein AB1489_42065, partial [Acidobacteriota bacterium]
MVKNRIKAVYRARAISYKGNDIYQPDKRQAWLEQLKEDGVRSRAQHLYEEVDCLVDLCEQSQKAMVEEARKHSAFKILDSIPTLGLAYKAMGNDQQFNEAIEQLRKLDSSRAKEIED